VRNTNFWQQEELRNDLVQLTLSYATILASRSRISAIHQVKAGGKRRIWFGIQRVCSHTISVCIYSPPHSNHVCSLDNKSGKVIAIKILNLDTAEDDVTDIQKEITILSDLTRSESVNITPYHGCFLNKTKLWIIMDFAAGGSVRNLVSEFMHKGNMRIEQLNIY
jgi:serine/threonine protein kinase